MAKKRTKRPLSTSKRADALRDRIQELQGQLKNIAAGKDPRTRGGSSASRTKSPSTKSARQTLSKGAKVSAPPELTQREDQVLRLTVEEYVSREIAKKLKIGTRTVESYRASLMQKLGCRSLVGLTRYAIVHRLVPFEFDEA